MTKQQQKEIFEELKDYIGSALRVARVRSRLTQKELAEKLGINEGVIDDIEQKRKSASLDQLQVFCKAIEVEVALILKMAKFLEEQSGRPEREILQDTVDECKYRLWEKNQRG